MMRAYCLYYAKLHDIQHNLETSRFLTVVNRVDSHGLMVQRVGHSFSFFDFYRLNIKKINDK